MTTKTTDYAAEFAGSPRDKDIKALFDAIETLDDGKPFGDLMQKMNRIMQDSGAQDRDRLPELVRRALKAKGRDPGRPLAVLTD